MNTHRGMALAILAFLAALACASAQAAEPTLSAPGIQLRVGTPAGGDTALALKMLLGLTVLSLAPAILISMTSFVRIVIVLSMLRHSIGTPETPPNVVIVSLSLFLTFFTMAPVLNQVNSEAAQPYFNGKLSLDKAVDTGVKPLREFMVRQTRERDLALMVELAHAPQPKSVDDISLVQLLPAFMLSELRSAFQVAFAVFLPFLLIDLIVASALMSLGMMMMPPTTVSLPLKILMFVLIDGWNLVVRALLGTFH
jgi:flagellar biosynthesis protein FliP